MTHHTEAERAELCSIINKHLSEWTKNMENYSYFGKNPGVSEDDYEEIAASIASEIQEARRAPAAPVQMPEPAAYVHTPSFVSKGQVRPVVSFEKYEDDHSNGIYSLRTPLYTEQQVRELLAAQASVSNGTLPSQPTFKTEDGEKAREPLSYAVVHATIPDLGERDCWDLDDMHGFARAIERAHGIGVEKP